MSFENICVLGASGLGKSTLVNTLFKAKLSRASCISQPFVIPKTVEIKTVSHGKYDACHSETEYSTYSDMTTRSILCRAAWLECTPLPWEAVPLVT